MEAIAEEPPPLQRTRRITKCSACAKIGHRINTCQSEDVDAVRKKVAYEAKKALRAATTAPSPRNASTTTNNSVTQPNPVQPYGTASTRHGIQLDGNTAEVCIPQSDNVIYFLYDLETNGRYKTSDIFEIYVHQPLDSEGKSMQNDRKDVSPFHTLVKPKPEAYMPLEATAVNNVTDDDVRDKPRFDVVGESLIQWMDKVFQNKKYRDSIGCLVAYNGNGFDVPLLVRHLE